MLHVPAQELGLLDGELAQLVLLRDAGHAAASAGERGAALVALVLGSRLLASFLGAISVRGRLRLGQEFLGLLRPRFGLGLRGRALELAVAAAATRRGAPRAASRARRRQELPEVAVRHGRGPGAAGLRARVRRGGEGIGIRRGGVGRPVVAGHGRPRFKSRVALAPQVKPRGDEVWQSRQSSWIRRTRFDESAGVCSHKIRYLTYGHLVLDFFRRLARFSAARNSERKVGASIATCPSSTRAATITSAPRLLLVYSRSNRRKSDRRRPSRVFLRSPQADSRRLAPPPPNLTSTWARPRRPRRPASTPRMST